MKFLLVLALALVAVSAEEEKKALPLFTPYAYNYHQAYNYPTVYNNLAYGSYYPYAQQFYNYQPVQYKPVEKEYEVEVKKIEFVAPEGSCVNVFGAPVPCNKAKRSAEEEEMKPMEEEKKIIPFTYNAFPYAYNNLAYNAYPYHYNTFNYAAAPYAFPTAVYPAAGCRNNAGQLVACRVARSADEEEEMKPMEEEKKIVPFTYNAFPYAYNNLAYNAYPYSYGYPYAAYNTYNYAPVTYTAPKPIVKEVEYLKPVFKEVVEKVELQPQCMNAMGFAVPCNH